MKDVGVVVGKFQVPYLHEGHIGLIGHVIEKHHTTIIVLGVSLSKCTKKHPLDFSYRAGMIHDKFPNVIVVPLLDTPGDDVTWSKNLDSLIYSVIGPNKEVCLYGSRDSFIKYYHGSFDTEVVEPSIYVSGTKIREDTGKKVIHNALFGAGAVWFSQNQWKGPMMCVDIAVVDNNKVLLGKRNHEDKMRFIGGKVDNGESLEEAALRELKEEANIKAYYAEYVASRPINDPRYMYEYEKVVSALFLVENTTQIMPKTALDNRCAGDDIDELFMIDIDAALPTKVVAAHKHLAERLIVRVKGGQ